jgi:hypothetical protein
MHSMNNISERSTTISPVNFFSCGVQLLGNVASIAVKYLSPKQAIRPETCSEIIQEIASKIRTNLTFRLWTLTSLFSNYLSSKEGINYLNALSILKTQSSDDQEISIREKQFLEGIFFLASSNKNYLAKFDFFVASSHDPQIRRQHKILKDLFITCDPTFFHYFQSKLKKLIDIRNIDEIDPLKEEEKLTVNDINILTGITTAKTLLENLKKKGIKGTEDMSSKLTELEMLSEAPFFEDLKRMCMQSRSPGMIFLGDRYTVQALNGDDFDCTGAMQHLFMGRICHIGVFVNPEGKGLHLSHVNRITKNHALMPIKNPLSLPFSFSLNLDIRPLIPSHLSEKQQKKIAEVFFTEFQKLAEEEHPELPLAETKQHLKMLIMGHKTVYSQNLDKVSYPSKNTPTMCSSYVGIIFLKAIQKMNQFLEEQGVQERIAHPFGKYENLMNLDILRLIYLWKQLKVITPSPLNETLAKVISSTSFLSLK